MKTFTKVLLGTLTTLATVTTPAMAGYQVDGYTMMDGSDFGKYSKLATNLINSLDDIGVLVFDGTKNDFKQCDPREDGSRTLGFYSPTHNVMVICTNSDILHFSLRHWFMKQFMLSKTTVMD